MLWLQERGYAQVAALRGGLDAWVQSGYPTASGLPPAAAAA